MFTERIQLAESISEFDEINIAFNGVIVADLRSPEPLRAQHEYGNDFNPTDPHKQDHQEHCY